MPLQSRPSRSVERPDWSISHFKELDEVGKLNFNPDYQRNFVWKLAQKRLFIDSIWQRFEIPKVFLKKQTDDGNNTYDVLDGQQRIRTLLEYMNDGFRKQFF